MNSPIIHLINNKHINILHISTLQCTYFPGMRHSQTILLKLLKHIELCGY